MKKSLIVIILITALVAGVIIVHGQTFDVGSVEITLQTSVPFFNITKNIPTQMQGGQMVAMIENASNTTNILDPTNSSSQLNYSIVTPSHILGNGLYSTDFYVAVSYPQSTTQPVFGHEQELDCPQSASPFYTSDTNTEHKVYVFSCTSGMPIEDNGRLFLFESEFPPPTSNVYPPYTFIVLDGNGSSSLSITDATVSSSITKCDQQQPFVQANGNDNSITITQTQESGPCSQQLLQANGNHNNLTITSDTDTVTP